MAEKPTYEELEQRIKALEQEKLEKTMMKEVITRGDKWPTHHIESKMNPDIHIPDVDLDAIINAEEIQSIMDDFWCLTHMTTAILDLKGNVIEATGWQDICTKFHRTHPKTAHNCTESDLFLAKDLKPGEYAGYKCKNGLWDVVTPLYIGTQHLGNIYTGQFFYDDEQIDEEFFIKQAAACGFDKNSYMDALRRVPKYTRETVNHLMRFLVKFTTYVSRISFFNIQLEKEIRERKQAEDALKESETHLRTLVRTIPDLVWLKDHQGIYLFCNSRFESFFGVKEKDIIGKTDYDFVDKELADFFRKHDNMAMAKGKPSKNEEEVTFAEDGHREILETIKTPMYRSDGQLAGVLGIGRDITDRKLTESALKENERLLNEVGMIAKTGGWEMDLISRKAKWTQGTYDIVEIEYNQPIPGPDEHLEYYLPEYRSLVSDSMKALIEDDRPMDFEAQLRSAKGNIKWCRAIGRAEKKDGRCIKLYGIFQDITDRKKMEEELLRAQKLESVGILAGGIAHDFNNILTTILGNVSLAKNYVRPDDEIFELLNEAETASLSAQTLTRQLLTFAKGGAPVKETASIKDILKESSLFVLRGSKSRCEFSVAEDLFPADVDVGQISQVIHNIVINANQAMPKGGIIEVTAKNLTIEDGHGLPVEPGRYVKISITDQGVGIAENYLLNIFDPYFTTKQEGSGLGLATTYSIIKKHDGHITVESRLGVGTTFHIFLPASDKAVPEKEADQLITGQGRILVMDDEAPLRKMVGKMLEILGYESEFAEDGAEAARMYQEARESKRPYDVVILDLTVPGGMGGREAMENLLEMDSEVKAIVSSGYSDDPVLSNFQEFGFKGVIPKPFESRSLGKVLHEVLKGEKLSIGDWGLNERKDEQNE